MPASQAISQLKGALPFLKTPIIVSAPMRVFAGPELAVATSRAGGLGLIGPGIRPTDLEPKLERARELLKEAPVVPAVSALAGDKLKSNVIQNPHRQQEQQQHETLPIGVGFQLFDGDLDVAASAVRKHKPAVAWLFVPAEEGQRELDRWSARLRQESPATQIWIQVGSVAEAVDAATSPHAPDALVIQGIDAGGHGLKRGAGVVSLLPEVADALRSVADKPKGRSPSGGTIPLLGAGGIADGRGVAAVLATGVAAGAVMGTRFLASAEADIKPAYRDDVLRVSDGGQSTVRTTLFDRLQGRDDWPARYDGRAIINASVRDDASGMDFATNKKRFQEMLKSTSGSAASSASGPSGWGDDGRLTAYVGSAVGLIRSVDPARSIVERAREEARQALRDAMDGLAE